MITKLKNPSDLFPDAPENVNINVYTTTTAATINPDRAWDTDFCISIVFIRQFDENTPHPPILREKNL